MKKYLISLALPTILGVAVLAFPRPAEESERPFHEEVISELWKCVAEAPQLCDELRLANPRIAEAVFGNSKNCLVCQAAALIALRDYDGNWADTIGEMPYADALDSCAVEVIADADIR